MEGFQNSILFKILTLKLSSWVLVLLSTLILSSMVDNISPNPKHWKKYTLPSIVISFSCVASYLNSKAEDLKDLDHMIKGANVLSTQNKVLDYKLNNSTKEEFPLFEIKDTVKKDLGFLISGEPGSGKTSTALALAQEIKNSSNLPVEIIALDTHGFKNFYWKEFNIPFVHNPLAINKQIKIIHEEYKRRKETGKNPTQLIIIFDEYMETIFEIENELMEKTPKRAEVKVKIDYLTRVLRSLITGGRKYNINLILINHSFNAKMLGIDDQTKQGFIGIILNSTADNHFSRKERCQVHDWLEERKEKYRAVLTGAFSDSPLIHPTHHDYDFIENKQPPLYSYNLGDNDVKLKLVDFGIEK